MKTFFQFLLLMCIGFTSFAKAEELSIAEQIKLQSSLYKNPNYHFQIMVPDTSTVDKIFAGSYFFPANEWRIDGGNNGKSIVHIPYFIWGKPGHGGYYYVYEVRIGISENKTDIINCIKNTKSTKNINGIPFAIFHEQDAAMNQYFDVVSYRTLHNGQCFAIEQVHYASNSLIATQLEKAQLQKGTEAIIETFKFF